MKLFNIFIDILKHNLSSTSSYAKLLKSLLNAIFGYQIQTMQFDQSQYPGPPLSVPIEEMKHLFGTDKF